MLDKLRTEFVSAKIISCTTFVCLQSDLLQCSFKLFREKCEKLQQSASVAINCLKIHVCCDCC